MIVAAEPSFAEFVVLDVMRCSWANVDVNGTVSGTRRERSRAVRWS